MPRSQTVPISEFKAKCLDILKQLGNHNLEKVTVTRHGRPVAIVTAPPLAASSAASIFGAMRGSVTMPTGFDLTQAINADPPSADLGILHQ
jgi:antitoxin (DNA-binding transcriptional repressor) of toxin-antitoxin stability system